MNRGSSPWFRNISIKGKLFFVMAIMATLVAGELGMLYFTVHTLSATRAFVAGEGLYSKSEKDAVFNLRKYAVTLDENDFRKFQQHLKVTYGDRQARLEMDKKNPDLSFVYAGLAVGRNHPDDLKGMVQLYQRFRHVYYIEKAIAIWTRGDSLIDQLEQLGNGFHAKIVFSPGYKGSAGIGESINRIDELNSQLTVLEDEFSYTLGEGSRWLEHLILKILLLIALTVVCAGVYLTISISTGITRALDELLKVSSSVAGSDFNVSARVFSNDEIGKVANSFNQMIRQLGTKTVERDQTEEKLRRQKDLYETLVIAQSEMGEGVVITEGMQIVFVNKALCEIYGYSEEELLALQSYMQLVDPEDLTRLENIREKRQEGDFFPDRGETSVKRKDGSLVRLSYVRRTMKVGEKTQLVSIVRNITEQKIAEKKMAELAAIVESSDDAILSKATDETILSWNKGAEKLFGFSSGEVVGKHISILHPEGREDEFIAITNRAAAGEHIEQFETMRFRKDGKRIYVSLTVSPISDERGQITSTSVIARDISRRRRAETDLKRKSEELARSNTELEQFAYIASHDLREPLRTITSYVQLLEGRYKEVLDEEGREFIGYTVDGAKRMDQLIQDLLTFSRVGNAKLEFEKVLIEDTLAIVTEQLGNIIEKEGAEITWGEQPEIRASRMQMIQLFQNLIMNAIKFRGDANPRITITGQKQKQGWIFSVADNGIGIDKKYAEKVFVIFQRLHAKGQYEGTGIGLAICKKIVERHGGQIWFESEPGKGTVFYFTIGKAL